MLIYHPAYDAYHAAFRMLAITESISSLEVDKARILDFYLLFPAAVSAIRLPSKLTPLRKKAKFFENGFHGPIDSKTTFRDMQYIQEASIRCIAAAGLISLEAYSNGLMVRTSMEIGRVMREKINQFIRDRQPISDGILSELAELKLSGAGGLKDRTGLMEFRYDAD